MRTGLELKSSLPMQSSLQRLVQQTAGYGLGAVINRVLGIVIACIYPVLLSKEEYGRLDVVFSFAGLLTVLFHLGLDSGLSRFYYEHKEARERAGLVSAVFYSTLIFSFSVCMALFLTSRPLGLWLYEDLRYIASLKLAIFAMPFVTINSMQLVVLRLEKRISTYNLLSAGNLVAAGLVGISAIIFFGMGPLGVFVGYASGNILTAVVGAWILRREIVSRPLYVQMGKMLGIGMPVLLSSTAVWLISYVNRPLLVRSVSAEDLGLYAIATGGVGMMAMLLSAFRNAWQPFAFSIIGQVGAEAIYGRALTLFTVVSASIGVCGSLFAPQILLVLNFYTHKNWSGAAPAIGPLALGTVFSAMYFVVQTGAFIARRTSVLAWTMGIAAATNILLNFVLIPRFGIVGAAAATCAGYFSALIILYIKSQRLKHIPYQPGKLAAVISSAMFVIVLGSHLPETAVLGDMLLRLAILAGFSGWLLATRSLTTEDLSLLWNINWRGRRAAGKPANCLEEGRIL